MLGVKILTPPTGLPDPPTPPLLMLTPSPRLQESGQPPHCKIYNYHIALYVNLLCFRLTKVDKNVNNSYYTYLLFEWILFYFLNLLFCFDVTSWPMLSY